MMSQEIPVCSKCGAPMVLKERLEYPLGPAKLIYECTANPNHVSVVDAEPPHPDHAAGAATLSDTPIDLSKELGPERIEHLLLSPDHTTLIAETESGHQLIVKAREGGKLRAEIAPIPPDQPPHEPSSEPPCDAPPESDEKATTSLSTGEPPDSSG
ncbi:hypothetical protein D3C87_779960 [compost metagenome]